MQPTPTLISVRPAPAATLAAVTIRDADGVPATVIFRAPARSDNPAGVVAYKLYLNRRTAASFWRTLRADSVPWRRLVAAALFAVTPATPQA